MYVTKKLLFMLVAISFYCHAGFAQTSLQVYPFNNSFGVKFANDKKFSPELRLDFQMDMTDGESSVYVSPQILGLYNFIKEEDFSFYSGLGVGGNFYNQASNNYTACIPIGGTYFLGNNKRFGLMAECGINLTFANQSKIKSYAQAGVVILLHKK
jgi:hypothetical protein